MQWRIATNHALKQRWDWHGGCCSNARCEALATKICLAVHPTELHLRPTPATPNRVMPPRCSVLTAIRPFLRPPTSPRAPTLPQAPSWTLRSSWPPALRRRLTWPMTYSWPWGGISRRTSLFSCRAITRAWCSGGGGVLGQTRSRSWTDGLGSWVQGSRQLSSGTIGRSLGRDLRGAVRGFVVVHQACIAPLCAPAL